MHPEDLNNIWVCSNCQTGFAFHSDILDHMEKTRHKHIKKFDLNTGRLIEVKAMVWPDTPIVMNTTILTPNVALYAIWLIIGLHSLTGKEIWLISTWLSSYQEQASYTMKLPEE